MILYNLVVSLYAFVIRLASVRNAKAKLWIQGRQNWRENLQIQIKEFHSSRIIWIHCASYGEFEQGRPLIQKIRKEVPNVRTVLTFFSPSGYEQVYKSKEADLILYLPMDTPSNAADFLEILKPQTAIFIKYEFWLNYLAELKKRSVPTYLVSAVFKPHHPFFRWYGSIFRRSLQTFTTLFIQDKASGKLLSSIKVLNFEICGDTRFDRVLEIKEKNAGIKKISEFKNSHSLIAAGSTWPKDEELLLPAFASVKNSHTKLLLAPHEVDERAVAASIERVRSFGLTYELYNGPQVPNADVLILNTIGTLSSAYLHADCAYIGGSFNGGLHNTLEPAVYDIPVIITGNEHSRYNEVLDMLEFGAILHVQNEEELKGALLKCLNDPDFRNKCRKDLQEYFSRNVKAIERIFDSMKL